MHGSIVTRLAAMSRLTLVMPPYWLRKELSATLSVACSHQDQVIVAPPEAEIILASDFTPNAGLFYRNGAALSVQPHPEFEDGYTKALAELRRGKAPDAVVETALTSLARNSDSAVLAGCVAAFLERRAG